MSFRKEKLRLKQCILNFLSFWPFLWFLESNSQFKGTQHRPIYSTFVSVLFCVAVVFCFRSRNVTPDLPEIAFFALG